MRIIETTTAYELYDKIRMLDISPETFIRVIIEELGDDNKTVSGQKKNNYLFLNDNVWDSIDTPDDLAENHDFYLYDNEEL